MRVKEVKKKQMDRGSLRNEMGWHSKNVGQYSPKEVRLWEVDRQEHQPKSPRVTKE